MVSCLQGASGSRTGISSGDVGRSTGSRFLGAARDATDVDSSNMLWSRMMPWMIRPNSRFYVIRKLAALMFIIYDIIVIPLDVLNATRSTFSTVVGWVVRAWWSLDLWTSFFTGYLDAQGKEQLHPRCVAVRYAKTWLAFDVFTVLLDWGLLVSSNKVDQVLRVGRALRLLKLVRLISATELEGLISERLMSEQVLLIVSVARSIAMLLWTAHLIACSWYGIGFAGEGKSSSAHGWVAHYMPEDSTFWDSYVWAFHWSLAHFAGSLIYNPVNIWERAFAVLTLFCTFLTSCIFVSSITTTMTRLSILASMQSTQLASLRRFISDNAVSASLAMRLQCNAQHALREQKRRIPECNIELLALVSESLRVELHYELRAPVLLVHGFFDAYKNVNAGGIQKVCHEAIVQQTFLKNDVIFSNLETPERAHMFFVRTGRLWYAKDGGHPRCLKPGQWVSEASLWTQWMHCGDLWAASDCTLLVLDAEKCQNIIAPFPSPHAANYAAAFVDHLNSDKGAVTDLPLAEEEVETILQEVFLDLHDLKNTSMRSNMSRATTAFGAGRLIVPTGSHPFAHRPSLRRSFSTVKLHEHRPFWKRLLLIG